MDKLDEYILESCDLHWRKVAMVITRAHEKAGLADDEGSYEAIANRVRALVSAGRLAAQGNLDNWRASEVRLRT